MRFRLQETVEGDGRRLGPQGGERFGPQPEVLEDTLRHIGLLDAGDEPHRAQTTRTLQDIDAEDPLQQTSACSRRWTGEGVKGLVGDVVRFGFKPGRIPRFGARNNTVWRGTPS